LKKLILIFLFAVILGGFQHGLAAAPRKLTILQTTDIHGAIGDSKSPGLLQIADAAESIKPDLWIDCGDLMQGSFTATVDGGASMVGALNAAGCDVWVPGNHDFDYGVETLAKRIGLFRGTSLAANMKSGVFPMKTSEWKMFERQGVKIAVIGIVPPYLGLWIAPEHLNGLRLESPDAALDRVMPEVMAAKPDVIVLAIHLGEFIAGRLNPDGKLRSMASLSSKFPQIDLILAGHSHQTEPGKRLYPGAWFVQAPPLGAGCAQITVEVDPAAKGDKVLSVSSKIVEGNGRAESKKLLPILDPVRKQAAESGRRPVAELDFALEPMKNGLKPNRLAELICLSMMDASGADAAFSGTLSNYRVSPGTLNERELFLLVPYADTIEVRSLSPSQFRTILRELESKEKTADCMMYAGVTAPDGIDGALLLGRTGKPIPETGRIKVAVNSYDAHGAGGRYPKLKEIMESARPSEAAGGPDIRDALRAYLRKHYPVSTKTPRSKSK
jgi:2',3'-cyclic-nucleotide 2'-phosphodiesterase (5'-nucleotidase family)